METKTAIQSKIIGINVVSLVSIAITALLADPTFNEMVGATIIMALNVLNIVLRKFYTDTAIEGVIKPKQPPPPELDPLEEAFREDDSDMYN